MSTLTIYTNIICALSINGSFYGILYPEKPITVPTPSTDTYISAVPQDEDYLQQNYFIRREQDIRLLPCSGRLARWNESFYELFFVFKKKPLLPPPVILKQQKWGDGVAGLAGGYFVFENNSGCNYFPESVRDFVPLSNEHMVLQQESALLIIDRRMNVILKRESAEYAIENGILTLLFTPGDMDFFTIEQKFDKKIFSTRVINEEYSCDFDRLRCFCQAVRLDLKDIALSFLSPSLKEQMSFEAIKDFLGVFDQTDRCRYLSENSDSAVALRYMVDSSNFHYMCYRFKTDGSTGAALIDDIEEI